MTKHHFKFADKSSSQLNLWIPDENTFSVILILPAMGLRVSYYESFAERLSEAGVGVATIDYRGHGESSVRSGRGSDWGFSQVVDDVQEVCWYLKKRINFTKLFLLGHSFGGQIAHLVAAKFNNLVDGVFSVASSDPYYKMWKPFEQGPFYVAALLVYPISCVVGHFPGYFFGFARREAATLIRDWGRAVRTGEFKLVSDAFQYEKAKAVYSGRIVAISVVGDRLAPERAVAYTLNQFPKAVVNRHVILDKLDEHGNEITHFSWVRYSDKVISELLKGLQG